MGNRKSWFNVIRMTLIVILAVLLTIPIVSKSTEAAEAKTLKIGGLFGLTGFFSAFDQVQAQEAQITADIINENGGIKVKGQPSESPDHESILLRKRRAT